MRICYLSTAIIPSRSAYSVHVLKMAHAFAVNGHDVQLVYPRYPDTENIPDDVFGYYGTSANFELRGLPWLPIKGQATLFALLAGLSAKQFHADLAHGRDVKSCMFAAWLGVPTIYEAHAPRPDIAWDRKLFERLIYHKKFIGLVCISSALRDMYLRDYPDIEQKLFVAHDGADIADTIETGNDDMPGFNVGYIGGLYQGRGIGSIVEIADKCPWANFHIVGGSDKDTEYWRSRSGSLSNIHFYGHLSFPEAAEFRKKCDVLLAPYEKKVGIFDNDEFDSSAWMSPLKVFEYMAAAKPIVSSNHAALKEILEDGRNALLCEPGNTSEWVAALAKLHSDPDLRLRLGQTAFDDVKPYTWTSRAENLVAIATQHKT